MNEDIYKWVINFVFFTQPCMVYWCYMLYKDLRKKDETNERFIKMIIDLNNKLREK